GGGAGGDRQRIDRAIDGVPRDRDTGERRVPRTALELNANLVSLIVCNVGNLGDEGRTDEAVHASQTRDVHIPDAVNVYAVRPDDRSPLAQQRARARVLQDAVVVPFPVRDVHLTCRIRGDSKVQTSDLPLVQQGPVEREALDAGDPLIGYEAPAPTVGADRVRNFAVPP